MKQVKTARGKILDMGGLAKKYEETRAVGNVPMNAKGDRLDKTGNVKATIQNVSRAQYDAIEPAQPAPLSEPIVTRNDPAKEEVMATAPDPDPVIISEEEKTREDGSVYMEIEYDDGSIETREIEE
jgi:hypothetical protein